MEVLKCIHKHRDKNNIIIGYDLLHKSGEVYKGIAPQQLKQQIKNGAVSVVNLKLTTDNRLINSSTGEVTVKNTPNKMKDAVYIIIPSSDVIDADGVDFDKPEELKLRIVNSLTSMISKLKLLNTDISYISDDLVIVDDKLYIEGDSNTVFKFVANEDIITILKLIQAKANMRLLSHPMNRMIGDPKLVSDDEMDYRASTVLELYRDDYGEVVELLLSYNYKLFKALLPIVNIALNRDSLTEGEIKKYFGILDMQHALKFVYNKIDGEASRIAKNNDDIIHNGSGIGNRYCKLRDILTCIESICNIDSIDYIDPTHHWSKYGKLTKEVSKVKREYKLSDITLDEVDLSLYEAAKAIYTFWMLGLDGCHPRQISECM